MKKLYSLFLGLLVVGTLASTAQEIPVAYYKSVNGLSGAALKNALSTLIYSHNEVSSYNNLPSYFRQTDAYYENGVQYWWDMYSNIPVATDIQFGKYMNREHAFPKSWWGGLTDTPAYVDLFHLYPAEADANMAKSNFPLGEVSSATFDNGVSKVGYAVTGQGGGSSKVFEPADEYKGDFARTYFYMVTCYQRLTWTPKYMYMLQQNDYPTLKDWAITLLLRWAKEDPVSQKEIDRNNKVYTIQNNRNPFIDYPDLCEYIWGDKYGMTFNAGSTGSAGDAELITPVQDSALDFGQTALGTSQTQRLAFMGNNMRGNLTLRVTGTDKAMFSVETSKLASSLVNATGGTSIIVTYTPTAVGNHSAQLTISDGGLTGSRRVILIGECLEAPKLTAPVATPATNITEDGYTANWDAPNDVIDYYIVTRTRYINGSSTREDILAEENHLDIEDFSGSTSESYNVRSVRLGVESPRSNEIFVEHSGITGIKADSPLGWSYYPGGVQILCGEPQTEVCVYDIAGRLVRFIPMIENNDIIELPLGVFVIVTRESSTPIRVLVN